MNIKYGLRGLFAAAVLAGSGCVAYGYPAPPGYPAGGPSYDRPSPGQGGMQTFRCESHKGRTQYCNANTRDGVRLVRQLSSAPCVEGRSWGRERNAVWVSQGCRAEFATGRGQGSNPGYPGQAGVHTLRCESDDHRTQHCRVDTRGGVRLGRQLSKAACVQGRSWGHDRNGIWVSQGCRAEFVIGAGGGSSGGQWPGQGGGQVLRCESERDRYRRCDVRINRGVELSRQLSKTQCVQGNNWGWDRNGIWVDRGCRAEFRVR